MLLLSAVAICPLGTATFTLVFAATTGVTTNTTATCTKTIAAISFLIKFSYRHHHVQDIIIHISH